MTFTKKQFKGGYVIEGTETSVSLYCDSTGGKTHYGYARSFKKAENMLKRILKNTNEAFELVK